jgi:predicted nucleic acid-binding protein
MALLVDTGPLYALADADDAWHGAVKRFFRRNREALVVSVTVVPETTYLLHTRLGAAAERTFVGALAAGELSVESLTQGDWRRTHDLMDRYPDLGFVDLSLVAIAERLRIATLVTLDRRHFARIQPAHVEAFRLLPENG